ncbi:3-phosphoserine/phosphohydroxythreonine transaminase [Colwellia sp. BRX10-3]|uniref:3-phosphoserine/phosphohydroxythreonine transaminase n=1 Tax=Colwellia sp. BRX10-3 TaxID=2759844 RepID=UPI0015F360D5|nr:3-phosphoserine/phosphohydroxythreonine transaminase [Colwellia sp. BRX10-3]MBA6391268.1 3-phosphoserine/phosphohydroxythreonine transaminase [Colwellia sp. BRX10-3]
MSSVYNFCAGPAMLPVEVMKKAQGEFLNYDGTGSSVMELSHRSKQFIAVADKAEANLRKLMAIPENYKVLFCHGGGRGQFSAVALNLLGENKKADYIVTGAWSKSAAEEASNYGNINVINVMDNTGGTQRVKPSNEWLISKDAAYVHYCPNETVDGIEIFDVPNTGDIPLIADMSSTILSREFDVSQFGLIYAGAQKNIGPSGLTLVIVREDLLGNAHIDTPSIMNYQVLADNGSMYNTPPTYAWYLAGLVFDWLLAKGGVSAIAEINQQKAQLLYQYIDESTFYKNTIVSENRSLMNIPFWLTDDSLSADFVKQAEAQGLTALKGHRMVGGMRASIYNAMPIEGVQALIDFMKKFEVEAK